MKRVAKGFFLGLLFGALFGLLFAPRKGSETRQLAKDRLNEALTEGIKTYRQKREELIRDWF